VIKHDESRRAFLVGTAAAAAGFAQTAQSQTAQSQTIQPQTAQSQTPESTISTHQHTIEQAHAMGTKLGAFLNADDSAAIEAFAERLMPGEPGIPGARDAGVLNYIDLALAGAYADMQEFYRRGLAALDEHCRKTYAKSFVALDPVQQDAVITALTEGKAASFTWPTSQAFFNTVRTHTMEGMFADPIYGGNKDFAGWRMVGFPGAQPAFTEADMASQDAFTRLPIFGLQAQARRT
jgi:gluconate 2-dehydrogenase gamma chain